MLCCVLGGNKWFLICCRVNITTSLVFSWLLWMVFFSLCSRSSLFVEITKLDPYLVMLKFQYLRLSHLWEVCSRFARLISEQTHIHNYLTSRISGEFSFFSVYRILCTRFPSRVTAICGPVSCERRRRERTVDNEIAFILHILEDGILLTLSSKGTCLL